MMEDRLNKTQICSVCQKNVLQLYQVSDCRHWFCQFCCIAYIKSQADNFSQAKCLQQGCGAPLSQITPIIALLDDKTKAKLKKFQTFQYLSNNINAKACKRSDCGGYFIKTSNCQCFSCSSIHCSKCYDLLHEGQCQKHNDQQMSNLNYKKCPKCSIWVQKVDGCEYITCKCGTDFCYKCGTQFFKDPCRMKKLWQNQYQARQLFMKIQSKLPGSVKDCILFIPRLFICIIILIPFTIIFCSVPFLTVITALTGLVLFLSPILIFVVISQTQNCNRCIGYILVLLFYPLIGSLFAFIFLILVLFYPLLRNKYHHGLYDPLDIGFSKMAIWYLSVVYWSMTMCGPQQ